MHMPDDRRKALEEGIDLAAPVLATITAIDPNATMVYDLLADGVIWSDELPDGGLSGNYGLMAKYVLNHRTRIMLGQPSQLEWLWNRAVLAFPNWIGFSSDRCSPPEPVLAEILKRAMECSRQTQRLVRMSEKLQARQARKGEANRDPQ